MSRRLAILANNGDLGGGEVMLLAIAEAARAEGYEVSVVAPGVPGTVIGAAEDRRFPVVAIHGESRPAYLRYLRRWARQSSADLLWCNGLVPALATAGLGHRVVHLHIEPEGPYRLLAPIARFRSIRTLVPSESMAKRIPGASILTNWTLDAPTFQPRTPHRTPPTIGFLGRLSPDKGLPTLAESARQLACGPLPNLHFLVAGEARFVKPRAAAAIEEALLSLGPMVDQRGWMSRADFFAGIDLAVFPSVWQEPFGLVVAEAMAAGCPFVISDAGALPEVAGPDHRFVSPAGDAEALAFTIETALADYSAEDLARARRRWATLFSPQAGRARLSALLAELLGPSADSKLSDPMG